MPRTAGEREATDVREPEPDAREAASASRHALFVVPNKRGDGFRASIRGHMFELADPDAAEALVPTPGDLLAVAIAADVAWFARRFLREQGVDGYVSVAARVSAGEDRRAGVDVTVDVSGDAEATGAMLAAALEHAGALSWGSARLRVRRA